MSPTRRGAIFNQNTATTSRAMLLVPRWSRRPFACGPLVSKPSTLQTSGLSRVDSHGHVDAAGAVSPDLRRFCKLGPAPTGLGACRVFGTKEDVR
jgi:hypothetical protein